MQKKTEINGKYSLMEEEIIVVLMHLEYAKQMEENGAGELLVTSMDRDGTQVGYDIDLMSKISCQK